MINATHRISAVNRDSGSEPLARFEIAPEQVAESPDFLR
jgi:hypothetical protein